MSFEKDSLIKDDNEAAAPSEVLDNERVPREVEDQGPFSVEITLVEELERLRPNLSRTASGANGGITDIFEKFSDARLKALCLSGGGIRSATFALGIIQSLAKHRLLTRIDYLSTVSGGGYIGTWLSGWIREEMIAGLQDATAKEVAEIPEEGMVYEQEIADRMVPKLFDIKGLSDKGVRRVESALRKGDWESVRELDCALKGKEGTDSPPSNPEPDPLRHLREYSNYMTPKVGIFSADTWALFGIYLRNLVLNWTIFVPILASILLLPATLRSLFEWFTIQEFAGTMTLLGVGAIAGALSLFFVATCLPSRRAEGNAGRLNTDGSIFFFGVLPLFILAFCSTTYWWKLMSGPHHNIRLLYFIVFSAAMFGAGYLFFLPVTIQRAFRGQESNRPQFIAILNFRAFLFGLASSILGGLFLGVISRVVLSYVDGFVAYESVRNAGLNDRETIYFCIAVPVFLFTHLLQSALFIGLASGETTDDDREWMARYGGWILLGMLSWLLINSVVLLWLGLTSLGMGYFAPVGTTLVTLISAITSLFGGFSSKFSVRKNPDGSKKLRIVSAIPQVASGVFLVAILLFISFAAVSLVSNVATIYFSDLNWVWLAGSVNRNEKAYFVLRHLSPEYLALCSLILFFIGLFFSTFINVNRFSLHGAYRDRLVRAYLGASNLDRKPNPFTGFDENDNRQLHRLKRQRPYHVLNATLNLVSSHNLAWQNRKATSFTMTPLHCGSEALGYRRTNQYSRKATMAPCAHLRYCNRINSPCPTVDRCQYPGKSLRLGTAMAISGAAADPNMGYYSSALVSFVMSLFNVRLGWWLGNTGCVGSHGNWPGLPVIPWLAKHLLGVEAKEFYKRPDPTFAIGPLLNETFGRTSEERRYLNITDGGHFENLALYEMIRRRCRLIILSDAAADQGFTFGELANAVEKCQVDFGVEIQVPRGINIYSRDAEEKKRADGKRYFIAPIIYPEQRGTDAEGKSWLLYCRPTLRMNEPVDILHYAASNKAFPHQSTGDQFFDERQFEAYRKLGELTFNEILDQEDVFELFKKFDMNTSPGPTEDEEHS